jgi:hypothetical protein
MAEINQGIQTAVSDQIDIATTPAVTPIGPPSGNIFLSAETGASLTTVPGGNLDTDFVYEFHGPECKKPRRRTRLSVQRFVGA